MIDNQFIDAISVVLASADDITHAEIGRMAEVLGVFQPDLTNNRAKRIHNVMTDLINSSQNPDDFKRVIEYIANPIRFTNNIAKWENLQYRLNIVLSLNGYELSNQGKVVSTNAAQTLSEAKKRFETLSSRLKDANFHPNVLKYCTQEFLDKNYFHAVFEASKGIFHRIRLLTGSSMDSASLIDQCFKLKEPIVIINGNKLQTLDEQSEYKGLKNLLLTIAHLYRNSKAHKLKYYNPDNLNDALTALTLMSLAHNLLDNCSNTRRLD